MKIGLGKPLCHLLGHWLRVREVYLDEHFLELFAHWICPICREEGASKLSEVEATLDRQRWKLIFLVLIPLFLFTFVSTVPAKESDDQSSLLPKARSDDCIESHERNGPTANELSEARAGFC